MSNKTSEGLVQLKEGSLYFKFTEAEDEVEDLESRPVLLFIHAGVTDHTLWDAQVDHLVARGWSCLQFDLFGFGSNPSEEYLHSGRERFDPIEHIDLLRQHVLPETSSIIPIGLSMGGSLAIGYTVTRPESVSGLAVVAGGLRGFQFPNTKEEEALFEKVNALIECHDVQGAANLQVRIWGDGPLQEPGRVDEQVAERMLKWNQEICARECGKIGGMALDVVTRDPPASTKLHAIDVPTAVAYGTYDETETTAAMKHVGASIKDANVKEFKTAHMINLELPDDFNRWLSDWLEAKFLD